MAGSRMNYTDILNNRKYLFRTVTPSFEPKHGKFMAYNHKKKVVIVDTATWDTKKSLKEEDGVRPAVIFNRSSIFLNNFSRFISFAGIRRIHHLLLFAVR